MNKFLFLKNIYFYECWPFEFLQEKFKNFKGSITYRTLKKMQDSARKRSYLAPLNLYM